MGLEAVASLIVAAFELKEVQLLRDAIRTADISSAALATSRPLCDRFERRHHLHPEPRIEPRRVFHPTPRYEPRPVIHPTPRIEQQLNDSAVAVAPCPKHPAQPSPLLPVWATLPPPHPATAPTPKIKLVVQHTDKPHTGTLIDFFI